MNEVISFLYENVNGFLATVGEGRPHVRAFQFMMEDEGKFYFATANTKDVYLQLKETPYIAYAASTPDFSRNLRLSGAITFANDRALNEKLMNTYEFIKKIYMTPDNPVFEVFYIEHGQACFWDFSGQSRTIEF